MMEKQWRLGIANQFSYFTRELAVGDAHSLDHHRHPIGPQISCSIHWRNSIHFSLQANFLGPALAM
jgi:hypothetical protein